MAGSIRVMTFDDVVTAQDLRRYYKINRTMLKHSALHLGIAGVELRAALRVKDKAEGTAGAARASRPLIIASGYILLACRAMTISAHRYEAIYHGAPRHSRRTVRRVSRQL